MAIRDLTPERFWRFVMEKRDVGSELKKLIRHILVLPVGSADAERGFSIFGTIRTKRRASIGPLHADSRMRIRINGPPLEEFDVADYKARWIKSHLLVEDPSQQRAADTEPSPEGLVIEEEIYDESTAIVDEEIDLGEREVDGLPVVRGNKKAFFNVPERKLLYSIF